MEKEKLPEDSRKHGEGFEKSVEVLPGDRKYITVLVLPKKKIIIIIIINRISPPSTSSLYSS